MHTQCALVFRIEWIEYVRFVVQNLKAMRRGQRKIETREANKIKYALCLCLQNTFYFFVIFFLNSSSSLMQIHNKNMQELFICCCCFSLSLTEAEHCFLSPQILFHFHFIVLTQLWLKVILCISDENADTDTFLSLSRPHIVREVFMYQTQ